MHKLLADILLFFDKNKLLSLIIVLLLLAAVLYPRFNMQDIAIIRPFTGVEAGKMTPDQKNYYNFTEYFKGEKELQSVWPPFSYRPMMPFLASLLPFDSLLSMSIVNVIANLLTLWLIFLILKRLNFNYSLRISGMLLYVLSFPLLYYGSSGFLEPTSNLFIYLIVYLTVSDKKALLPPVFLLAALTKEVTIIALPFVFVYFLTANIKEKKQLKNAMYILFLSLVLFVAASVFVRTYFSTGNQYLWTPSFQTAIDNLSRAKTYLSFDLGLGLPGILAVWYSLKKDKTTEFKKLLPWYTGMSFAFLLSAFSVIAAYSDGRFIWTGYPFMIVISVYFLKEIYSGRFRTTKT